MNPLRELAYRAKVVLLKLYGPADLEKEHDPVVQVKQEHQAEKAAEEGPEGPAESAEIPGERT